MLFTWLKKRRRQRLLRTPFPETWLGYVQNNVAYYALLAQDEQAKLRDDLRILMAENRWEGCNGLTMTDEIKVTIAAQAALLLLELEHDYFGRSLTILVYPSGYRAPERRIGPGGVVEEGYSHRLGEAWYRGPIVLAWDAVLTSGQNYDDGRNVVLHEFAHQLDFVDGLIDGTPPLKSREQYWRWYDVMLAEYNQLIEDVEAGRVTLLDPYGATDAAEFFAVATECFFEQPVEMQRQHPQLYQVLRGYYGQDTAERFARSQGAEERNIQ